MHSHCADSPLGVRNVGALGVTFRITILHLRIVSTDLSPNCSASNLSPLNCWLHPLFSSQILEHAIGYESSALLLAVLEPRGGSGIDSGPNASALLLHPGTRLGSGYRKVGEYCTPRVYSVTKH